MELAVLSLVSLVDLVLAFLVLKNNPKSATNIIFVLLSFAILGWLITVYISLIPFLLLQSLFWIRLSIVFAVPFTALFFLFSHTFPSNKIRLSKKIIFSISAISIALMASNMSPLAFKRLDIVNNSPNPVPGIGLFPFVVFVAFSYTCAIFLLVSRLRKSTGLVKEQLRYLMYGLLLMLGLIITTIMIPVVFLRSNLFLTLAPLYILVFLGSTAYAILRHKLFDIRLLVARAIAYLGIVILVAGIYIGAVFALGNFVFPVKFSSQQLLIAISLAFLLAISFQWITKFFTKLTDSIFFKEDYDDNKLITTLSHIMAQTLDLNILLERISKVIMDEVKVTKLAIVLTDNESVEDIHNFGFNDDIFRKKVVLKNLFTKSKFLVFEDLESDEEKFLFRDLNISVCIPLSVKGKKIGLFLLGEKASGDIYSSKDFNVFHILEPELAIAIENAQDYQKIKRFNITLREEVDLATAKLQTANNRLKQLDKLKDDFVSVASHELRTPMTAIKSYLWVALNQHYKELSEDMQRYLNRAYISVERLINLVNDMLNISRIEGGRIALRLADTDLVQLSRDVYDEVLAKANEKNIDIVVVQKNVPKVLCDKDKIHEVLLNLIGNSLKFTKGGGTISLDFKADNPFVTISVTDTGVGISRENLKKLFTKFGRLENSYVAIAESGGTGLGLYISKSLVELHKGKIEVDSQGLGKGTTFSFTLPIVGTAVADELSKNAPRETEGTKELEKTKLYIN